MSGLKKTVVVVGAGVSGLAFARKLSNLAEKKGVPLELTVLEASSRAGGIVSTETHDGFLLEKGPDSFLSENPRMLELCRELGLEGELVGTQPAHRRTFIVHRGRLKPLPEGFHLIAPKNIPAFLATSLFSPAGKLRMLAECWMPKAGPADESVGSFIRRRFGREALERVGQPMIAGVYSGDPEKLSILSTMPRFREAEAEHGSVIRGLRKKAKTMKEADDRGPRYSLFITFKRGMRTLTDALERSLPSGSVRLGFKTASIARDAGQWIVTSENGQTVHADALCLAVSAKFALALTASLSAPLSSALGRISYESVATLNLAFDERDIEHPLDGFGFVVPRSESRPLMGCTFVHRKFAGRVPEGKALLRVFAGGAFGHETFALPDAELERTVLEDLSLLLGIRKKPLFSRLVRYPGTLPQYRVGHAELLLDIDSALAKFPPLVLTGSSYRGTGIPDCISDAETCADRLFRSNLISP